MASEITPEEIRRAQFRTVMRGLDSGEVAQYLDRLATEIDALFEERERLAARLGEYADRDLETEFDSLGREVAAVLQAAREAADSMRERATHDAARWRSEAMAEVDTLRKEAKNDAEALRGDAWATGSELLSQSAVEARRLRAEAERDVLTVMGEAEREAHRLISSARRDAEDMIRAATMDAEKTASEAKKHHDDIIDQAHRQTEAAQERTRALEERREELIDELETVRSALSRLEGTLEERRETLDLSSTSTSVKVVPAPRSDPDEEIWQLGETVRVIPPAGSRGHLSEEVPQRPPPSPPEDPDDGPVDVPRRPRIAPAILVEREQELEPEVEPEPDEDLGREPDPEPDLEPASEPEPAPIVEEQVARHEPDDVGGLFASLRGTHQPAAKATPSPGVKPQTTEPDEVTTSAATNGAASPLGSRIDAIELRDTRLLPITNRALRGVKKAVTDAQNVALDSLRTEEGWTPEGPVLAEMMRADLIGLWAESYSAGHATAEEMMGSKLRRGDTPHSDAAETFGEDLAGAVSHALIDAGDGQREKQSATSRVFRGWRTDEAERRVRELALIGYHQGLVESVADQGELEWVASGTPCSACRAASSDPAMHLPPVHAGCECTLAWP
jgi:DivIVA domain-containing protein